MNRNTICRLLILTLFIANFTVKASGQEKINRTNSIEVKGEVKQTWRIQETDLLKFKVHDIGDLVIYNHLGEKKGVQKGLKGVLLREVLADLPFLSSSPKLLSEFYLTVIASDGYKVVFSWNELFNSPSGDSVYLIVEKDSISIDKMTESILLVSTADFKTGRRNVKAVSSIQVGRVR